MVQVFSLKNKNPASHLAKERQNLIHLYLGGRSGNRYRRQWRCIAVGANRVKHFVLQRQPCSVEPQWSVLLHRDRNGLFVHDRGEQLSFTISRSKSLRAKSNNTRRCGLVNHSTAVTEDDRQGRQRPLVILAPIVPGVALTTFFRERMRMSGRRPT